MVPWGYAFGRNYLAGLIVYLGSGDRLPAARTLLNFSLQTPSGETQKGLPMRLIVCAAWCVLASVAIAAEPERTAATKGRRNSETTWTEKPLPMCPRRAH